MEIIKKSEPINSFANNEQIDDIDLGQIFSALIRRKSLISIISGSTLALSIIYAYSLKPLYEGQFQIVLDVNSKSSNTGMVGSGIQDILNKSNTDGLKTEVTILKSPSVLKPVYDYEKRGKEIRGIKTDRLSYKKWLRNQVQIELLKSTSVLNIAYRDHDKSVILPVLNKISKAYKDYSSRDRRKGIDQGIDYLKGQIEKMKVQSEQSLKDFQRFATENSLGEPDGMIPLTTTYSSFKQPLEESNGNSIPTGAGNQISTRRYANHFSKLSRLEAELVTKSALLKPSSKIILNLESKIKSLKDSLKRPSEILLEYRGLKRKAQREEYILADLEVQLGGLNLEKARQSNSWELISTPTLLDAQVAPNKKRIALSGLFLGIIFGCIIGLIYDKKTGIIYEVDELKGALPFPLMRSLSRDSIDTWQNTVDLLIEGPLSDPNNSDISIINLEEVMSTELKFFCNLLRERLKNRNLAISNNLVNLKASSKILLLSSIGTTKREQLKQFIEEYKLQDKPIIGWIVLDSV